MEQSIVKLQISGAYIAGCGVTIGAVGSHDEVLLEMDFRPSALWKGTTRRAIFSNALGEDPTPILLTTDLLEEGQGEVYLVPVPQEAKSVAGECFLTVEGFVTDSNGREIIRCVTEEAHFRVLPSKLYTNETEPVTPSQAEQLQAEIDSIKETIVEAGNSRRAAKASEEAAAKSQQEAATARDMAEAYSAQSAGYRQGAKEQAEAAAQQVERALQAVSDAQEQVQNAASEADRSEEAAARAEAEAERVTVPAAVGVYNLILEDRVTGQRYALLMEDGLLCVLEVRNDLDATELMMVDTSTGATYVLGVDSGKLYIEEAT